MKLHRLKKNKQQNDIDITSLLDILVIMIVFLLKSYSASSLELNLSKELNLADTSSQDPAVKTITVQLNNKNILFYENREIGSINNSPTLLTLERLIKENTNKNMSNLPLSVVIDQEQKHKNIKKLINTIKMLEIKKFQLVLKEKET